MAITLSPLRWPSLAQDIAVMAAPGSPIDSLDHIYSSYNIDEDELNELLKVPLFQQHFQTAAQELKAQGSRAGAIYRAGTLAQGVSEKLYRDFLDGQMKAPDAIKFLDLLYKASGMTDKSQPQVAVQVNNGVQLPQPVGLDNPKFQHLVNQGAIDAS